MRLVVQLLGIVALCAAGPPATASVLRAEGPVRLAPGSAPPVLTAAEIARRAERLRHTHLPGPVRTAVPGGTPATAGPARRASRVVSPRAASTFRILADHDLRGVIPAGEAAVIGEPCAVRAGHDLLAVGNWYAAMSVDNGQTWSYVDPAAAFPRTNDGFCCDQSALYDPVRDLFVWTLMYSPDATGNTVRIAVAQGTAAFAARAWTWYDLTTTALGLPAGRWLDYPQLALGANHLHVTANAFRPDDTFASASMIRIPLDELAGGGEVSFRHVTTDRFTVTPAQGAGDVMYLAAHEPAGSAVRIFRWPEGDGAPGETVVPVRPYAGTGMTCVGPDQRDWCERSDDRVMTGWVAGGIVGFMWNAAQDDQHAHPYVRVLRLRESDLTVLDEPELAAANTAYQYPAVAVNARGHLGGVVAAGGGARHPGAVGFLADDLTSGTLWEVHDLVAGDSGPAAGQWGDFLCSRPDWGDGTTWIVTGFALRGGGGAANVHHHAVRIGRERDIVCGPDQACPDDGEPCTTAICADSRCSSPPHADGAACDDADACTLDTTCQAGACTAGRLQTCADGDPCTDDRCDLAFACIFPARQGYDGVSCAFQRSFPPAACDGQEVAAGVSRWFMRAGALVERARTTVARSGQRRRLRAAARALTRARRGVRRSAFNASCRRALLAMLGDARHRVRAHRRAV